MSPLLMVNPRKKRRSAKQKAATRKLVAANRRSKSPAKRRGSSVSRTVTVTRRRNPIKRRTMVTRAVNTLQQGAIGSAGAIAASVIGAYLPIPENMKEGNMKVAVDALLAIGLGFTVSKFADRKLGENMAQGGVTVALHSAMKGMIQKAVPNMQLGDYDNLLGEDLLGMGYYDDGSMGFYDSEPNLGYSGAGMTSDFNDDIDSGSAVDLDDI